MKNFFLIVLIFTLALFVAPLSLATGQAKHLSAAPQAASPAVVAKINYTLPYPGLLPDSPLYFLKQIRDKILEFLIADPVRKAEFYLLQADKRLGMGMTLIDKGKSNLAESTISKGEKYMNLAVTLLSKTKAVGVAVPGEVVDRLSTAIGKHMEVLNDLISKANGAVKSGLEGSLSLLEDLQKQVAKMK